MSIDNNLRVQNNRTRKNRGKKNRGRVKISSVAEAIEVIEGAGSGTKHRRKKAGLKNKQGQPKGGQTYNSRSNKSRSNKSQPDKLQANEEHRIDFSTGRKGGNAVEPNQSSRRRRGNLEATGSSQSRDKKSSRRGGSNAAEGRDGGRDIYNIFGARILRPRSAASRSYKPEYNSIDFPQQPKNLCCAICGQQISGTTEVMEALEVQPGEFLSQRVAQKASGFSAEFVDANGSDVEESQPAHFNCVLQALTERCQLEKDEAVAYMGAGKFAIVQGPQRMVKRMIERDEWQQNSGLSPLSWSKWRQDLNSHTLLAALSIETDV